MYFSDGEISIKLQLGCGNLCSLVHDGPPQSWAPCVWMVAMYVPKGDHCTKNSVQFPRLRIISGGSFFLFQKTPTLSPLNITIWSRPLGSPNHQRRCSFSLKSSMRGAWYSSSIRPSRPYRSMSVSLLTASVCFLSSGVPCKVFVAAIACSGV